MFRRIWKDELRTSIDCLRTSVAYFVHCDEFCIAVRSTATMLRFAKGVEFSRVQKPCLRGATEVQGRQSAEGAQPRDAIITQLRILRQVQHLHCGMAALVSARLLRSRSGHIEVHKWTD